MVGFVIKCKVCTNTYLAREMLILVPRCEDEFTKVAIAIRFKLMRVNKGRRNKDHGCVASHPTI
jgi:hypothetical protein